MIADATKTEYDEAEICTVGSVLIDPTQLDIVRAVVSPRDFTDDGLRLFYEFLLARSDAGKPINDIIAVSGGLRGTRTFELIGGAAGIAKCFQAVPHAAHAGYYARMVANRAALRKQSILAKQFQERLSVESSDAADNRQWLEAQLAGTAMAPVDCAVKTAGQIARESIAAIEEDMTTKRTPGVLSGFYEYDRCFGSLICGEVAILAARPSMGKTALGLQIAEHAALVGKRTLVVSLEMRDRELIDRMLARYAGVDGRKIRNRKLDKEEITRLKQSVSSLDEMALSVWAPSTATARQIRGIAKMESAREPLGLLVVDYLGLIRDSSGAKERHLQIADASATIKQLAKELNIPVLMLCQVNRDAEGERPNLAMLRDSGAVEQDADMVMFLHKESRDAVTAEWIVEKNRNGTVGMVELGWIGASTEFYCVKAPTPNKALDDYNNY